VSGAGFAGQGKGADLDVRRSLLGAFPSPFARGFVGEPWDASFVPDATEVHAETTRGVREALAGVRAAARSRALLLLGPTGVGKSHVIRRLAHASDLAGYLAYVRPSGDPRRVARELLAGVVTDLGRPRPGLRKAPIHQLVEETIAEHYPKARSQNPGFAEAVERLIAVEPPRWEREDLARPVALGLADHVAAAVPALKREVAKVLFLTQVRRLKPWALDWLAGRDLSEDEARALLGVAGLLEGDGADENAKDEGRLGPAAAAPDETAAMERMLALGRLLAAHRPVLLCIDQTETLSDGRGDALRALVAALRGLTQGPGYLALFTCLEDVWHKRFRPLLDREALSALGAEPLKLRPLRPPTPGEAAAIVAARLAPVYRDVEPPYPTYPFPTETIAGWLAGGSLSARELLKRAAVALDDMRAQWRVEEVGRDMAATRAMAAAPAAPAGPVFTPATTPPPAPAAADPSPAAGLARVRAMEAFWRRRVDGPPSREEREDRDGVRLVEGLRVLLRELARRPASTRRPIAGLDEAPEDERLGLAIHLAPERPETPGGLADAPPAPPTVGVAWGETPSWRRLQALLPYLTGLLRSDAFVSVLLLRETPVPEGWEGTVEKLVRFEQSGGRVTIVDARSRRAIHALREIHAAAASGDLELAGEPSPPEAAVPLAVDCLLKEPDLAFIAALRKAV